MATGHAPAPQAAPLPGADLVRDVEALLPHKLDGEDRRIVAAILATVSAHFARVTAATE